MRGTLPDTGRWASRLGTLLRGIVAGCLIAAMGARAEAPVQAFDLPGQPLGDSLQEVAERFDLKIAFYSESTEGHAARPLQGTFTAPEAFDELLAATDLEYVYVVQTTVAVRPRAPEMTEERPIMTQPQQSTRTLVQRLLNGFAAFATVAATVLPAAGASAEAGQEAEESRILEEIIVSVQKRDESVLEVPIAVSAYGGDYLRESALKNMEDLVQIVPGLSGGYSNSYVNNIAMRGVAAYGATVGSEPAIGFYTDGVYHGRNGAAIGTFFDLERVEVLKGPQGLLFGRNASVGAINVVTAKPDLEATEAFLGVLAGERGRADIDAMVNLPLNENWAIRLAAVRKQEDGYVSNITTGEDHQWYDLTAARASLRHENDWGDATLSFSYEDRARSGSIYLPQKPDGSVVLGRRTTDQGHSDRDEIDLAEITLTVNIAVGETMNLRSLTGFYSNNFRYDEDWDGSAAYLGHWLANQDSEYMSQEFVLSGGDERLSWFAGASLYAEDVHYTVNHVTGDWGPLYGVPFPLVFDETVHNNGDYSGWAVYGDTRWQLSESWDVSIGGRYTADERDGAFDFKGQALFWAVYTPEPVKASEEWTDFSPRASLRYFASDDVMLYATVTQGFKAGGFDGNNLTLPGDPVTLLAHPDATLAVYDAEEVLSYEAGVKGNWLEERLRVAASVYTYTYEDLQIDVWDITVGVANIQNVGEIEGTGLEVEAEFVVNRHWDVRVGAAWADAEANGIPPNACAGRDCDGNRPIQSPEQMAFLALNVHGPLARGEWFGTLEYSWRSERYGHIGNLPNARLKPSGLVDIWVGWQGEQWRLAAFVENAADSDEFDSRYDLGDGFFNVAANPIRPRLVGVSLSYRFSGR